MVSRNQARVRWEQDEEADVSWADPQTLAELRSGTLEALACAVQVWDRRTQGWRTVASCCGIVVRPGDTYCRIMEAELALEGMS